MRYYDTFQSPQGGMLLLANDAGLAGVFFDHQKHHPEKQADWKKKPDHKFLQQAKRELTEYFAGRRTRFDVALAPEGTPFQRSVWKAISSVSFGETISYGELARRAGHPGCARDRPQPDRHHRALPSHLGGGRLADGLCRWPGAQARPSRAGERKPGISLNSRNCQGRLTGRRYRIRSCASASSA